MVFVTGSRANSEYSDIFFFGENKTVFPGNIWSHENQSITGEGSLPMPSFLIIYANLYAHKKMYYTCFILHFAVYPDAL